MNRRIFLTAAAAASAMGATGALAMDTGMDAQDFQHARRFAATRFGRIAYVEHGRGPAALFIHGYPLNGYQWRGAIERLGAHRRCIAADSMGLGHTEVAPGQAVDPGSQAEMFPALMDALSINQADIVANDSGGAIAQLIAARHPHRVRSLLLTNCDARDSRPPKSFLPTIEAARKNILAERFLMKNLDDKAFARSAGGLGGLAYTFPDRLADETVEAYFRPLVASPERIAQFNAYTIGLERDVLAPAEPALRKFHGPVRIVWGMGDNFFDPANAEWLDKLFPHSRGVRRVEGAKLFFPEEMPELIAEEAVGLWRV